MRVHVACYRYQQLIYVGARRADDKSPPAPSNLLDSLSGDQHYSNTESCTAMVLLLEQQQANAVTEDATIDLLPNVRAALLRLP